MLKQPSQAEHAHVLIPHELADNFKRIAHLLAESMLDTIGPAAVGEDCLGCGHIGRGPLEPLLPQFGGDRLHPHADRPGAGPFQPQRICHRHAQQLRLKMLAELHGMRCDGTGRLAGANAHQNPLDHDVCILGVVSGCSRAARWAGRLPPATHYGTRRRTSRRLSAVFRARRELNGFAKIIPATKPPTCAEYATPPLVSKRPLRI